MVRVRPDGRRHHRRGRRDRRPGDHARAAGAACSPARDGRDADAVASESHSYRTHACFAPPPNGAPRRGGRLSMRAAAPRRAAPAAHRTAGRRCRASAETGSFATARVSSAPGVRPSSIAGRNSSRRRSEHTAHLSMCRPTRLRRAAVSRPSQPLSSRSSAGQSLRPDRPTTSTATEASSWSRARRTVSRRGCGRPRARRRPLAPQGRARAG